MRWRAAWWLAIVVGLACSSRRAPPRVRTAEEVLASFVDVVPGADLERVRAGRPQLAATGWSEGPRATWIDPSFDGGLEVEADGGTVRSVAVGFGPERSDAAERLLKERLGAGTECASLPEGIASFRPTLWQLDDGSAVTLLRKQRLLQLRVERPASRVFREAWAGCKERAGRG